MPDNSGEKSINLSGNAVTYVLIGLLLVASFAIGMLWTKVQGMDSPSGNNANNPTAVPTQGGAPAPQDVKNVNPVSDSDHVRGNRNAKIAIIEYSDFECPFCARHHPTMEQLVAENGDDVMWVYRHFPLSQIHPKAQTYAEATECAAKQGGDDAFWAMGDALFESAPALDELGDIAADLGLNKGDFETCLESDETLQFVLEQQAGGAKVGVTGTPGNIILNTETGDAQLVSGAVPFSTLQGVVDSMMN